MTLGISMLKNIFPLPTKMQDYHLEYPNVLLYNVNKISLKKLFMLT